MEKISTLSPVVLSLIATIFTWFITALGASIVYFFKKIHKTLLDCMLAISAGIMIAASIWSLIIPSIEKSNNIIMPTIGFIFGGLMLVIFDLILNKNIKKISNQKKRILMLITSITLHNIPEGLAVGIAFGSIAYNLDGITIMSATCLAIGIGIQNFPEGCAVSIPLRREGISRNKAFFYGQLSAIVEPISGVLGAILVLKIRNILPFFLSFAAGAMIFVVTQELIPESQTNQNKNLISMSTLIGFTIMMILDVLLS